MCSINYTTNNFDLGDTIPVGNEESKTAEAPSHDQIKAVAHMRIADAAQVLGIKEANLRALSRVVGFKRWPGRKLSSVINQAKVLNVYSRMATFCVQKTNFPIALLSGGSTSKLHLYIYQGGHQCRASTAAQQKR